ncbi:unnamed protein product, partial [Prorocentrum cordatum]
RGDPRLGSARAQRPRRRHGGPLAAMRQSGAGQAGVGSSGCSPGAGGRGCSRSGGRTAQAQAVLRRLPDFTMCGDPLLRMGRGVPDVVLLCQDGGGKKCHAHSQVLDLHCASVAARVKAARQSPHEGNAVMLRHSTGECVTLACLRALLAAMYCGVLPPVDLFDQAWWEGNPGRVVPQRVVRLTVIIFWSSFVFVLQPQN